MGVIMSQHRHRTSEPAIFLGAVLLCLASITGNAKAERNTRTIPTPLDAGLARPAPSTSAVPNRSAPPGKRGLTRGRQRRNVDAAQRMAPAPGNTKPRAVVPSPLPKIVEKKSVSDDPLAGLIKL
jgi:hypothetical protein